MDVLHRMDLTKNSILETIITSLSTSYSSLLQSQENSRCSTPRMSLPKPISTISLYEKLAKLSAEQPVIQLPYDIIWLIISYIAAEKSKPQCVKNLLNLAKVNKQ